MNGTIIPNLFSIYIIALLLTKVLVFEIFSNYMLKNRHKLRNKDAKNIANIIEKNLGCHIMGTIEIGEFKDISILFIEGRPYGMMVDNSPCFLDDTTNIDSGEVLGRYTCKIYH